MLYEIAHFYINKIAEPTGLKVLLLDDKTLKIISLVATNTDLNKKEIYLIENIKNKRSKFKELVCLLFTCKDSVQELCKEFQEFLYSPKYFVNFNSFVSNNSIERLAENDTNEVVADLNELYFNFFVYSSYLFISTSVYDVSMHDTANSVLTLLLSLKKHPIVRYEKNSTAAMALAQHVNLCVKNDANLFDFKNDCILLVLDRKNDPLTPLLFPWTYEAMLHHIFNLQSQIVQNKYTVNSQIDQFYKENMYNNFGDLGSNIKQFVDTFQSKTRSNLSIQSIEDMKRFVEDYPEFKKLSGNVSKHVSLVSELSNYVQTNHILTTSQLEQNLACNENHKEDVKQLMNLLEDAKIPVESKIHLYLIYALRYEKSASNITSQLESILLRQGISAEKLSIVKFVLDYAGNAQRQNDIFLNSNLLARGKSVMKGLQGVENVYTQHTPILQEIAENALKGRLKDALYPFVDAQQTNKAAGKTLDVVIFVVGGVTYQESKVVHTLNQLLEKSGQTTRVFIGGDYLHNANSFLEMVGKKAKGQ